MAGRLGRWKRENEENKEGRKEERKKGSKEERKEGRKEGKNERTKKTECQVNVEGERK